MRLVKSISPKIILGSSFVLILLLLPYFLYYQTFNNYQNIIEEYQDTDEKILKLKEVFSILTRAEHGEDAFVLTGNKKYLEAVNYVENNIWKEFKASEEFFPNHIYALHRIKTNIEKNIEKIRLTIKLENEGNHLEAIDRVNKDYGRTSITEIETIIDEIQKIEKDKRLALIKSLGHKSSRNKFLILTYTIVTIIIIVIGAIRYSFEIKRRKSAEEEFLRINKELELSNQELFSTNEELNASMEEVSTINEELNRSNEDLYETSKRIKSISDEANKKNTQLKVLNKELVRISLDLQDIYNNTPCAYHSLDREGYYIKVNDTELVWLGYRREELIGKRKLEDFVSDRDRDLYIAEFEAMKETGFIRDLELSVIKKDGTELSILLNSSAVYDEEGFNQTRSTYIDNTDLKKTRQLLMEQKKEMESFSYSISHDLRAPLRAITGFTRILENEHDKNLNEESKRLLKIVSENARRMGQLIDNLLEFARLGKLALSMTKFDLRKVIEDIIEEQKAYYKHKEYKVNLSDIPEIYADQNLLRQAWYNLISNAFKYSSKVSHPTISIEYKLMDKDHEFKISDNGAGFDMRYANKLFGVFQRLHTHEEFEGTGVGLAIVAKIIKSHGGNVSVESEIDKGTSFYLRIPKNADRLV